MASVIKAAGILAEDDGFAHKAMCGDAVPEHASDRAAQPASFTSGSVACWSAGDAGRQYRWKQLPGVPSTSAMHL
jgi:hypothetical protein